MVSLHGKASTTQAATEPVGVEIHARNVEFDWENVPLEWIPGEPVASDIVSSILHVILPEGSGGSARSTPRRCRT
ncbi:Predicted metal-dependent hydrolase [Tsukamurella pulmonis]|nr:Predicted metal-dependent hydrolase [Tsukamurella pulmonis]